MKPREDFSKAYNAALAYWKSTPGSNWHDVLVDHMVRAYEKLCEHKPPPCPYEQAGRQCACQDAGITTGAATCDFDPTQDSAPST